MDHVKDVAEVISILTQYGYNSSSTELAAIHALNNVSGHRGMERMRAVEDALVDLVSARAVFDVSEAMRICIFAINTIDSAARYGVYLSVQDAVALATGTDSA